MEGEVEGEGEAQMQQHEGGMGKERGRRGAENKNMERNEGTVNEIGRGAETMDDDVDRKQSNERIRKRKG